MCAANVSPMAATTYDLSNLNLGEFSKLFIAAIAPDSRQCFGFRFLDKGHNEKLAIPLSDKLCRVWKFKPRIIFHISPPSQSALCWSFAALVN